MEGGEFECNQILDIFCFWLVVAALVFTRVPKNKNILLKFYVVSGGARGGRGGAPAPLAST